MPQAGTSRDPSAATSQHLEELKQAYARLGVCVVALLYMAVWSLLTAPVPGLAVLTVGLYTVLSIAWIFAVRRQPGHWPARRILAIVGDLGINTVFMHLLQSKGAAFYPMYLWIIVGNGVRFGPRYLYMAATVGVAYFVPMLWWSPYWRANLVAGGGLAAGLIILPLFYLSLIRRLQVANTRLTEELERSNAAAEAKAEFLANMSHELRTPMSGVLGVSNLLRRTQLDGEQLKLLDLLHQSASSLLSILDQILDFSLLEAGKKTMNVPAPVDLQATFESVLHLLRPVAEEKGLDLHWELQGLEGGPMPVVSADPMTIRQILFNLIGNAVKFTERGQVEVTNHWRRTGDQSVDLTIEVHDSGIGIAEHDLAIIFNAFEQAESRRARRFGGTGLGLAISRQLARGLGGDIEASSVLDEGTTFKVRLPFELAEAALEDPAQPIPVHFALPLTALVVDDNAINRLVTSNFLDALGISTFVADDGLSALELWRRRQLDVIFMDVQMPVLDGIETTKRIRSLENGRSHVPIIALTANASEADREACLAAGMDLHLKRPFTESELRGTLGQLTELGMLPKP